MLCLHTETFDVVMIALFSPSPAINSEVTRRPGSHLAILFCIPPQAMPQSTAVCKWEKDGREFTTLQDCGYAYNQESQYPTSYIMLYEHVCVRCFLCLFTALVFTDNHLLDPDSQRVHPANSAGGSARNSCKALSNYTVHGVYAGIHQCPTQHVLYCTSIHTCTYIHCTYKHTYTVHACTMHIHTPLNPCQHTMGYILQRKYMIVLQT